jgi:hypothetical protein
VALSIAVALVVVVGWVCYRHWGLTHLETWFFRSGFVTRRWWLANLVIALLLAVPYALALLVWGRGVKGRVAGFLVATGAGIFWWGYDRIFNNYVWKSGPSSNTSIRVYEWGSLLGIALLVTLAWGLARRVGRAWLLGVLVGPLVAAVLRELGLRWSWWHDRVVPPSPRYHWQLEAAVFVAPFVAGALACWAIETLGRRTPDMASSA